MKKEFINFNLMAAFVAVVGLLSSCSTQNEEPTSIPEDELRISEIPANYYENKLSPIPLTNSLKHIGDSAFFNCKNEFIVIPEGVESIGRFAFAKKDGYKREDMSYFREVLGNLEWIYLPSSLKTIGESACVGSLCGITSAANPIPKVYWYNLVPNIIMTSPQPPEGFVMSYWNNKYRACSVGNTYVPEKYLEKYKEVRYREVGEKLLKLLVNDYEFEDGEDVFEQYPMTISSYSNSIIPLYSYKPIDIEITKGEGSSLKFYYSTTPKNEGEITEAEWDTSDHSIAEISSEGVLTLKGEGETYVQCIVYTKASDENNIKFYFFHPIKVSSKMENGHKSLVLN